MGLVLIAYDGSELAARAISQAAGQVGTGRKALVVCVWQSADLGFSPVHHRPVHAYEATEVHRAAEETAAHGSHLAGEAGFQAHSRAIEAAPTWKGIVSTAEESAASLIVIGSHRHSGLAGHFGGSVAAAVLAHAACPVLIVPHRP